MPRPISITNLKRDAKRIKTLRGVSHHEALDLAAQQAGLANWNHALNTLAPSVPPSRSTVTAMENNSTENRRRRFETIVAEVQRSDVGSNGEGFNFADAEWVAVEAKSLGLLVTERDAELLIGVIVKHTAVTESICREEVQPVLKYRDALDTRSCDRLQQLIISMGLGEVAHSVGISRPTLDKLISGGRRGPLFRHQAVSAAVVKKARTFLTSVEA